MIGIIPQGEQRELRRDHIGQTLSNNYKPMGFLPIGRLICKRCKGQTVACFFETQTKKSSLDWFGNLGNDNVVNLLFVQPLDHLAAVEPNIGTDSHGFYGPRNSRENTLEKKQCAGTCMNISRSELYAPVIRTVSFETQKRMIRRTTSLERIVSDICFFSIDHKRSKQSNPNRR